MKFLQDISKAVIIKIVLESYIVQLLLSSSFFALLYTFLSDILETTDLNAYKIESILAISVLAALNIVLLTYFILSKRRKKFKGALWDYAGNPHCPADNTLLSCSAPEQYRSKLQAQSRHICTKCGNEIYFMEEHCFISSEQAFELLKKHGKT